MLYSNILASWFDVGERVCFYLGLFIGVPNKGESIEGHLFYVANATEHFFVVRYERKQKKTSFIIVCSSVVLIR